MRKLLMTSGAVLAATFLLASAGRAAPQEGYLPDEPRETEPAPPVQEPAPHTLFDGPTEVGGWGALIATATAFNGSPANTMGVRGGVMFGRVLTLGITGWGITTIVPADDGIVIEYESGRVERDVNVELGAGGFFVQVDLLPFQVAHPHVFGAVGAGGLTYTSRRLDETNWGEYDQPTSNNEGDSISYGELGAGLTVNMVKWMRLDLSASWRFVGDVDLPGLTESEIGGPSGSLAFRFGRF